MSFQTSGNSNFADSNVHQHLLVVEIAETRNRHNLVFAVRVHTQRLRTQRFTGLLGLDRSLYRSFAKNT